MTTSLPSLEALPRHIPGNNIHLRAIAPSGWSHLLDLRLSECRFMGKHVGDPTADSKSFRDRDAYVRLCENLKRREENISGDGPGRFYFIHLRRHDQRIVGYAEIYKHPIAKERLEIGYAILPNYQQQGFATEAARVLSDAFVRGLESPLHAHINLKNERSAHVLMKAGFREAGPSICRTNNGNAFVQRHFMKTPNPSGQPALTP